MHDFLRICIFAFVSISAVVIYRFRGMINFILFFKFCGRYRVCVEKLKSELFAELGKCQSGHENLRKAGSIRILEIGVGPGSNFGYYPRNCLLSIADTNPDDSNDLWENWRDHPKLILNKIVRCKAENLEQLKDGKFDVVVTTMVLCSVQNINQVLKEIKRVLAPGGKYFFLEHEILHEGGKHRRLQKFIHHQWSPIFSNCHLTGNIGLKIEQAGFSRSDVRRVNFFRLMFDIIFQWLIGPHIVGTAQK